MPKHQFFPLPRSLDRHGASSPAAAGRLPTPCIGAQRARLAARRLAANSRAVRTRSEITSGEEARNGPGGAIWQSVLGFFLEGFALYGASLHWVATTAVTAIASEVDARQRQSVPGTNDRNLPRSLRMPSTSVGFASAAREVDRYRFIHPGWPAMIWRAIASRWTRWRREREIKKAVVALAELDNRTLRDMGIPHPSQIERIVRYGRDS